jgi:sugar O-acyltransferase (sialic acid O-acetyltransferase NeuD family)
MYLYGASGHAKVIIDILIDSGIQVNGLIDDDESLESLLGYPVVHGKMDLSPVIVSIGNNPIRKKVVDKLSGVFGKAIHPTAILSSHATVGEGSVVMQGAIIQSGATIGKHCIINTGALVDHECEIEDFVHLSPHTTLCGNVFVGEGSWIGAGAVVLPGVKIGKWSIVGAGSVVAKDIPDQVLASGNRCKIFKRLK